MTKIERQKRQIDELVDLLNAHRFDDAADAFAGEWPAFEDVPANHRMTGRSGIADAFQMLADALPDLSIEVVSELDQLGESVRELIITGAHRGTYQGIEPSGNIVRLSCAAFFGFDRKTRLMTQRLYFDNDTLRRQMRGREMPYLPERLRIAA